jgi:hypothetical protein
MDKTIETKIRIGKKPEKMYITLADLLHNIKLGLGKDLAEKVEFEEVIKFENRNAMILPFTMDNDHTGYIILQKSFYTKLIKEQEV